MSTAQEVVRGERKRTNVYRFVIEDVVQRVREMFLNFGVDEHVLQELQQNWETKLVESGVLQSHYHVVKEEDEEYALKPPIPTIHQTLSRLIDPNKPLSSYSVQQQQAILEQLHKAKGNLPQTDGPLVQGSIIIDGAQGSRLIEGLQGKGSKKIKQTDGPNDSDDEEEDYEDEIGNNDFYQPPPIENNALGSDLDEDSDEEQETDNFILCQFERVTRTKNRWRCTFRDGVMHVNRRDYLFHRATGEFECLEIKIKTKIRDEYQGAVADFSHKNDEKNEHEKNEHEKMNQDGNENIKSQNLNNQNNNIQILPPHSYPIASGVEEYIIPELNQADSIVSKVAQENNQLARIQPPNIVARRQDRNKKPKIKWHPPWKLMRVISGHLGWVRAIAVDHSNEWFATGSTDRTIKIWDMASGTLKLSLTGHISTIRGLAVSDRHPYLFSAGEDKMIKCWDLEQNKVVRQYHGHLSGIHTIALHPTLDLLMTGGRDCSVRVWDMRTRQSVHVLAGHKNTVSAVKTLDVDPQVITGSMDSTVRLWDLAAGKTIATLTHHKKSIRALAVHPQEFSFCSGSPDAIKKFKLPQGNLMLNLASKSIINTLSVNQDYVLFSGADNGSMAFYDYHSGYNFQTMDTIVQPGSLDCEAGVFASCFDVTGLRLLCGEADKTIKIYKEDEFASESSHPIKS